jgi:hypothetical protein
MAMEPALGDAESYPIHFYRNGPSDRMADQSGGRLLRRLSCTLRNRATSDERDRSRDDKRAAQVWIRVAGLSTAEYIEAPDRTSDDRTGTGWVEDLFVLPFYLLYFLKMSVIIFSASGF